MHVGRRVISHRTRSKGKKPIGRLSTHIFPSFQKKKKQNWQSVRVTISQSYRSGGAISYRGPRAARIRHRTLTLRSAVTLRVVTTMKITTVNNNNNNRNGVTVTFDRSLGCRHDKLDYSVIDGWRAQLTTDVDAYCTAAVVTRCTMATPIGAHGRVVSTKYTSENDASLVRNSVRQSTLRRVCVYNTRDVLLCTVMTTCNRR